MFSNLEILYIIAMSTPNKPLLIAEVKTMSPYSTWRSERSWGELFEIAAEYGDWISIHTDVKWNGSFHQIEKARKMATKPILAKGIHREDYDIKRALDYGADAVLVVGRIPEEDLLPSCLLEPRTIAQLQEFREKVPEKQRIVWNSRNLHTGKLKRETFEQARTQWPGWLCQASNISTPADILPGTDAILVGQELEQFTSLLQSDGFE